jgi:hypothetical protein
MFYIHILNCHSSQGSEHQGPGENSKLLSAAIDLKQGSLAQYHHLEIVNQRQITIETYHLERRCFI